MVGMSVFEIDYKMVKSVHFGLNLPSLAKKVTNLIQFLTFFILYGQCLTIFVANFLSKNRVPCHLRTFI